MNVNEAVARILKLEGVEWISCFPSNNLIESAAMEGIRTVMFRHERGAIMAADGFSRMNDRERFGVVITQGGPGSENSMGGIAQAFGDNIPILYFAGGPALNQYAVRPNFSPVRTYESVSKYGEVIMQADQVASTMRRAFHNLRNGRPGPVLIEIPSDVANQEVDEGSLNYQAPKRAPQSPAASDIKDAVKLLLNAKKPVIWSGMGVLMSKASEELRELAELTEIPVYSTMPGKSSFDDRHPLALGAGSSATSLPARTWVQESDVLFAVGSSMTRTGYGQPIPNGKVIIHNTESIEDLNKDFSVDVGIPGDAKLTLLAMIAEVKSQIGESGRRDQTAVAIEIAMLKAQWMADWKDILNSDETPINTYRVIGELERNLDKENSIVTHDAGAPRDTIMPFYTSTVPHSYIGWGKTTHLGYGIPLMIGAKLANPDKFCLNFMGDGAFGMSGLDIETSVREGAPITTVVLNNGGMATYPGGYPVANELFGTTRMGGDYAKLAEGMGAVGITITQPGEVANAIKQAMKLNAEGRTVLLDIHTNLEARRSNFA
ncbi:MAG: thiamine pyrophosphate-requiring protein [Dehalococcoidia bacterium]|nr:thiamine pyrophosphate-requiring protein [Dehalococcoidia bacterium]|tara:strand:+ start:196 stop:1836 length:1641 start_codon:yes stop_codon:yes gene_type:complete